MKKETKKQLLIGAALVLELLFLLLYLPFLPYRKLRNTAVVVNAYADVR